MDIRMDIRPDQVLAMAETLRRQNKIIFTFFEVMRPFAAVADAQKHTDCAGMLQQSDWEAIAQIVDASTQDQVAMIMQDVQDSYAH